MEKGYYYKFDRNGNITEISPDNVFNDSNGVRYSYDSLDQLIRVDDVTNGDTWIYTYDLGGNILSKSRYVYTQGDLGAALETVTYGYTNNSWGDLLTSYNGNAITYDEIGNPVSDGLWTYEWEHGRQLAEQSDGTTTWTYTYDASSQRTSRSNGQVSYYYIYDGITLKYLRIADITTTIETTICEMYFEYGQTGLVAIHYVSSSLVDTYYAVNNAQRDIVALVDGTGTAVVNYTYDAWGNLRGITGSKANTLGQYNPIRYRGYVYDTETQLYFLNSRYYNPDFGRFLNADIYVSTGQGILGENMFAYCRNNPVNRIDVSGTYDEEIADGEADTPIDDEGPSNTGGGSSKTGGGAGTQNSKATFSSSGSHEKVIEDAKKAAKEPKNQKPGSYRIKFNSGKEYDGKGFLSRAIRSALEKCKPNNTNNNQGDFVKSLEWSESLNNRQAYIDEYFLQLEHYNSNNIDGKWINTYNKYWSPGRGYLHAK